MAITRVGVMANPPTNIGDYTHILAHLDAYAKQVGNQGMLLTQWGNASGVPAIAKGSYISHGGTLFVVDTEDFLVAAPASNGTYYLRVAGSGASLAISWVTSIGGYTWNAIYNGLYDGSENQILPYMLIKTGAVLEKWKISNLMQGAGFVTVDYLGAIVGTSLAVTGAISGASVDTGQGATEVHLMDQNVRTIDNVTFSRLGIITSRRQIIFNGATTGVMDNINIGELVDVTFQGWHSSESQGECILPSGYLFCVALATMMEGAVVSTGVKTGGSTIATVVAGLPHVYGVLRVWRIA